MNTSIYVYAAHRFTRGIVFGAEIESDDAILCGDIVLYADSAEEAIERARTELSIRDPLPWGTARAYAHATARAVLYQLGAVDE